MFYYTSDWRITMMDKMNQHAENKILIVEDSPTQAEKLKYTLEKNHFIVLVAEDGIKALESIEKYNPTLVISDIVMPKMDGYELCREIKARESSMDIPVILLTSLSNSEDVLEGLACGADNFLTKPYNEEYLISHIERIFTSRKLGNIERVRVGVEILFAGKKRFITADQQQMLTLLISTYEAAMHKSNELLKTQEELRKINENQEELIAKRTAELSKEIEEHKKTELELLNSERRADLAVKSANIGMWDLDLIKDKAWRSPLHDQIFGYDNLLPDWGQEIFMKHVVEEDRASVAKSFEKSFLGGHLQFECRIIRSDDILRWIMVYGRVQHNEQNKPVRMLGTVMDITDRKEVEAEITIKNKELQKSNNEKDLLFSIIAHDLKSPFNAFMGLTDILVEVGQTLPTSELFNIYKRLNDSANDLYLLLENLLEWALLQKQSVKILPKEINLSAIINENIIQLTERARQKGIQIINEIPTGQMIFSDEKILHTILRNLLSNAIKFTKRNGSVKLSSEIKGDKIEISVIDTGIGISKASLDKLFKVGEKVGVKGTDGEASTGLGLILCKELINKLKGKIWAHSELDKGSIFVFSLKYK